MKKILMVIACATLLFANKVNAQEEPIVIEEDNIIEVTCKDYVLSNAHDNWFIQIGAGINLPIFENYLKNGDEKHHVTTVYNAGFGKWMTPYLGWRISLLGGSLHWDNGASKHFKYANANFDLMWDMFNSLGGVNTSRVFSIVPFVGLGGTFAWDYAKEYRTRATNWMLPISAGIQFRFRLCKYLDFFAEGRVQGYGDNFNQDVYGKSVDVNFTAIGGLTFNISGKKYDYYNPCVTLDELAALNSEINALREDLAACGSALAAAEAQLPCPVYEPIECPEPQPAAVLSAVRFSLNSAKVTDKEKIGIYNLAQWMNENPDVKIIIKGYADAQTGTSEYNMTLSEQRAENVADVLVDEFGIDAERLTIQAEGSDSQVYDTNNWNRIVIFKAE